MAYDLNTIVRVFPYDTNFAMLAFLCSLKQKIALIELSKFHINFNSMYHDRFHFVLNFTSYFIFHFTGRAQLIRSHSPARIYFKLSGNLN